MMRFLIGVGCGLVIAAFCLAQLRDWFEWCPLDEFRTIHEPAVRLAALLGYDGRRDIIAFTMVAQWLFFGAFVGLVLQYVPKRSV